MPLPVGHSPLLPTHARGKVRRRSRGVCKPILYVLVAFAVGYAVFAHFRAKTTPRRSEQQSPVQRLRKSEVDGERASGRRTEQLNREPDKSKKGKRDKVDTQVQSPVVAHVSVEQLEERIAPRTEQAQSLFALSALDIDGQMVQLSKYAGKVVLVVNVASACGYTDQNYKGLQATYLKYKDRGLEILGFPCNQFGGQEAGSEMEIKAFCTGRYHVSFPIFSKIDVNGPKTHPVYQFLKRQLPASEGGGGGSGTGLHLGWNFFKFLVDSKGQPVKLFHQSYDVASVEKAIEHLLDSHHQDSSRHTTSETIAHEDVALSPEQQAAQQPRQLTEQHSSQEAKAPEIRTHHVDTSTEHTTPEETRAPDIAKDLWSLRAVDIDGQMVQLSKYAGKVVLVVNVASACGFTDQNYQGLQATYLKYKEHGLEILGFPCNQFGSQESGSESEIKAFCSDRYHVTFPMFSKIDVNGPTTHPVYQFLKRQLPTSEGGGGGSGTGSDLTWNFFKFLVNKSGQPVKLFHQGFDSPMIQQEIYRLLHEA